MSTILNRVNNRLLGSLVLRKVLGVQFRSTISIRRRRLPHTAIPRITAVDFDNFLFRPPFTGLLNEKQDLFLARPEMSSISQVLSRR